MSSPDSPSCSDYEVIVRLKPEVLDPEARAIQETLTRIGFAGVKGLQVSKRYVLSIEDHGANAAGHAEQIAREYLANPVSETFQIRKL